ncbi:MAG TPA: hypothetical protein VFV87_11780 [Pirellulaceae bacterium]|nr:hypothetical protein [Pirellulaceae bacterium]
MARMLQALKNLEARSPKPAPVAGVLSHLDATRPPAEPAGAQLAHSRVAYEAAAPAVSVVPTMVMVESAWQALKAPYEPMVVETPPPIAPAAPPAAAEPPRVEPPTAEARPVVPATRPPTGAERAVRRTLGEPHRRQPLADLASRLRQDAHQTGSRTLLLVGIGAESTTHETALHVAALMAEEGGRVLLIDADLARRQLSTDLDSLQEPGFSDLARENVSEQPTAQPTAFEGLAFLPAGRQRFIDLENSRADRLARALGQLSAEYDLVLLSGGQANDPAAGPLGRLSDATYIVVELGTVEAGQAQQALRELRAGGARVLGCIATGVAA